MLLFGGDTAWTQRGTVDLKHLTDKIKKHVWSTSHWSRNFKCVKASVRKEYTYNPITHTHTHTHTHTRCSHAAKTAASYPPTTSVKIKKVLFLWPEGGCSDRIVCVCVCVALSVQSLCCKCWWVVPAPVWLFCSSLLWFCLVGCVGCYMRNQTRLWYWRLW